jgi:hypothetical protein
VNRELRIVEVQLVETLVVMGIFQERGEIGQRRVVELQIA